MPPSLQMPKDSDTLRLIPRLLLAMGTKDVLAPLSSPEADTGKGPSASQSLWVLFISVPQPGAVSVGWWGWDAGSSWGHPSLSPLF